MSLEAWLDIILGVDEKKEVLRLMQQAVLDSCITCGDCESNLEADCDVCGICGWRNPLRRYGLI